MDDAKPVVLNGKNLYCTFCGGDHFNRREAQLHTAAMTFFNMEWLNKSATVFVCSRCGRLEWFLDINAG